MMKAEHFYGFSAESILFAEEITRYLVDNVERKVMEKKIDKLRIPYAAAMVINTHNRTLEYIGIKHDTHPDE